MHSLTYTDYQGLARKLHAIYIVLSFPALSFALGYIVIRRIPYEKEERGVFIFISVIILINLAMIGARVVPIIQDIWGGNEVHKRGVTIVDTTRMHHRSEYQEVYFSDEPETTYRYWGGETLYDKEVVNVTAMPISKEILEIKKK